MAPEQATFHIPLTPFDHIPPRNYVKSVCYFPLKPGVTPAHAFAVLQKGLHRTFVQLPWLSGKTFWQSDKAPGWRPGQLEIRHGLVTEDSPMPYQLRFNELETSWSYGELQASGFPTDAFQDEELLWAPFLPDVEHGADVWVAQANFIPGACLIAAAPFHPVSDGVANVTIFNIWAENCKALQQIDGNLTSPKSDLPPAISDRTMLERLWKEEGTGRPVHEIDAASWKLLGLDVPSGNAHDNKPAETSIGSRPVVQAVPQRSMKSNVFYIPPSRFIALKEECIKQDASSQLSRNDALAALIWRALLKARASAKLHNAAEGTQDGKAEWLDAGTEARLEMTLDGRPEFSQSLPATYLGNVVLINQASTPLSTLVSPQTSIADVARLIRNSAAEITPARVLDSYTLVESMKDYGDLKMKFTSVDGWSMLITSLLMFPIDTISFGDQIFDNGGKADAMRPLMSAFNRFFRICFILPRKKNGGVEFVVSLYEEEMERLLEDEEFGRFAMEL